MPASDADGDEDLTMDGFLSRVRQLARDLVAGSVEPYKAGWEIWSLALGAPECEPSEADRIVGLWMVWGRLTDRIELKPEERTVVEQTMRRAAREWLAVEGDEAGWREYFDRWIYDELGYPRSS